MLIILNTPSAPYTDRDFRVPSEGMDPNETNWLKCWWFRLRYGVAPHWHEWKFTFQTNLECQYVEKVDGMPVSIKCSGCGGSVYGNA